MNILDIWLKLFYRFARLEVSDVFYIVHSV